MDTYGRKARKHMAKNRVARGEFFWFVELPHVQNGQLKVLPCRESGHPFDERMFREGNYFRTREDACQYATEVQARMAFRNKYLADLERLHSLTPAEKKKVLKRWERQNEG